MTWRACGVKLSDFTLMLAGTLIALSIGLSPASWAQSCQGANRTVTIPLDSPPALESFQNIYSGSEMTVTNMFTDHSWVTIASYSTQQTTYNGGAAVALNMTFRVDVSGMTPGCYIFNPEGPNISLDPYNPANPGDPCYIDQTDPTQGWFFVPPNDCEFNDLLYRGGEAANYGPFAIDVVGGTNVSLIDPVPDLVTQAGVDSVSQLQTLLTKGTLVSGVAADGVAEVIVRIQTTAPNNPFSVALLNDQQPPAQSGSPNQDGALGNPGDTSFSQSQLTVTSGGLGSDGEAYAFVVYRAPVDFARPTSNGFMSGNCNGTAGTDDKLQCRSVSIQVTDMTLNKIVATTPVTILRPPVTLIHGVWTNSSSWDNFFPLVQGPNYGDSRFHLIRVNYDGLIGPDITASDPPYPASVLERARENSLGLAWNATDAIAQMKDGIRDFKTGNNPVGLAVAAVQTDIVAHSMGGLVARTVVLLPDFLQDSRDPTFSQGYIHKLITIDTPHLGTPLATQLLSPQETGGCLQLLLAKHGSIAFNTVTLSVGQFSGAVGDFVDNPQSTALSNLVNSSTHPLPTSLIEGIYNNFAVLDNTTDRATLIRNWPFGCPSDPLAQKLTSAGWQNLFSNLRNDAIVPEASQLDNLPASPGNQFPGYVHSDGTTSLGFSPPGVLDGGAIATQVIFLLNTPATNSAYYNLINP